MIVGFFFEETNGIRSKFSAFMKARSNLTFSFDTFIPKVFCVELSSSLHKQIFAMSYEENGQFVYSFLLLKVLTNCSEHFKDGTVTFLFSFVRVLQPSKTKRNTHFPLKADQMREPRWKCPFLSQLCLQTMMRKRTAVHRSVIPRPFLSLLPIPKRDLVRNFLLLPQPTNSAEIVD